MKRFYLPVRVMILPVTIQETTSPPIIGDGQQSGVGGAHAAGELEVLAEEHRGAEHRDADQATRPGREPWSGCGRGAAG